MPLNIDWALLRDQKRWLNSLPLNDEVEGLLNLLDAIQDEGVAAGHSAEVVFGEPVKM